MSFNANLDTNLQGRLRNTDLPKSHALMPLFEAVVNSIHAIEEAELTPKQGTIEVEIIRYNQEELNLPDQQPNDILGFKITDNGIGFNDKNLKSFKTLDSDHKADKGCRGVGRLLWLKAFERANVNSIFIDEKGKKQRRTFCFDRYAGLNEPKTDPVNDNADMKTVVNLDGFSKPYQKATSKTTKALANSLFEHCLWYFVRAGGAPKITINGNDSIIDLDDIYNDHLVNSTSSEKIPIKKHTFELNHVKLRNTSSKPHIIAYCAANRLVKEENINGKIAGLYGKCNDENGDFVYACYVSSAYLDERSKSERTGFNIEEDIDELFSEEELSFNEIKKAVMQKVGEHLSVFLERNKKDGRERVENFVSTKAPRYRPILARLTDENLTIDPLISDKDLELTLHKHLSELEQKLLDDGHNISRPKNHESEETYNERLQDYLKAVVDLKKSDLANYVFHRKVILDLLEIAIKRQANGKYAREDLIHNLIMPMGKDSNQLLADDSNLWLIDERLAFHNYLASDKTLKSMPITGSNETKEPDICALNIFDNPLLVADESRFPLATITIVEIKRPMRNDAKEGEDKNPIEQANGYLERIRNGGVTTEDGRPIPKSHSIPGFCFIVCDLTSTMITRCNNANLKPTSDNLGYFGYNDNYKAYIEVISFDKLVNSAKERNKAFFDKLGLATK